LDLFYSITYDRRFVPRSRYRLFKALGASYLMLWTGRNIQQFLRNVMEGQCVRVRTKKIRFSPFVEHDRVCQDRLGTNRHKVTHGKLTRKVAFLVSYRRLGVAAGDAEADKAADELPELHATCAGLKAFCTSWSASLIEESRKCCGGQVRSRGEEEITKSDRSNNRFHFAVHCS